MTINYENLKRIFNNFLNVPDEKIDMTYFRTGSEYTHECDSSGCLLGHSVILDIDWDKIPKKHSGKISFIQWGEQFTGISEYSIAWSFLFSGCWPDDKVQILSRLKYFIDNEDVHPKFAYIENDYYLIIHGMELNPYKL